MIINGASRSNGAFFARHLMRADQNERVQVVELRGLAYAQDVREAFREMQDRAAGTNCKNYFYHANLNTREDERLTPEQWAKAVDTLEGALGLEGQARFIVEHEKEGRTHRHVIWSRIDPDTMTAVSDSHNYRTHEEVAVQLEEAFGHAATARALTRDKATTPRPEPNVRDWESFRAQESRIDPKVMRAELTELWQHADSGPAFAAALQERGYILARGDRRDFCVIDAAGDEHSLARRISGVKAAEIRARMADVDPSSLPSVDEGRALARERQEEAPTETSTPDPVAAFDAVRAETIRAAAREQPFSPTQAEAEAEPQPQQRQPSPQAATVAAAAVGAYAAFEAVRAQTRRAAEAEQMREEQQEQAGPGSAYDRFRVWCGTMREYVAGWGQQVQDYWHGFFKREEPEEAHQPTPQQGMEPSL